MPSAVATSLVRFFRTQAILIPFAAIWVIYLGAFAIFYPSYIRGSLALALVLQALFPVIIFIPSLWLRSDACAPREINRIEIKFLAFLIGLSVVAALALFYDRILQGVDYSRGVCGARYQMNSLGESRTGISSIFSFLGLLFGYFYFAALPIVFMRKVSRVLFWTVIVISFALLMAQSVLTASRFAAMIYIVTLVALAAMRLTLAERPRIRAVDIMMSLLIVAAAGGFVINEFSCRARLSHQNSEQYAASFTKYLLIPDKSAEVSNASEVTDASKLDGGSGAAKMWHHIRGLLKITAYYGVHSGFTFAAIIDTEDRPGVLSLAGPISLLPKIGINIHLPPVSDVISGRFVSMPGSFYYDSGLVGLLGLFVAFALMLLLTRILHKRYRSNMLAISVLVCLLVTLYLSPVTFVINVMHFPFIAFAMISAALMLDVLNYLVGEAAGETPKMGASLQHEIEP